MNNSDFYSELISSFKEIAKKNNLLDEVFVLKSTALSTEEAIGNPDRKDFPLMKGKEKLLQTDFKDSKGQAYTDMPGNWSCTLKEIIDNPIETNFDRAMLIAALNAVCANLGLCCSTIHCKNNDPEDCAKEYLDYLKQNYNDVSKIGLIGLQPSILQMLTENYKTRIVDLNPDAIGTHKFGILIEDSEKMIDDMINWADLILCTGSTVVNGSLVEILNMVNGAGKEILFFGTSIAGTAAIMNLKRFCPKAI